MAFLKQPKSPDEIKMIGVSAVKKAYNDLASDYNKIIDYDWLFCPKCGEVSLEDFEQRSAMIRLVLKGSP